MIYTIGHAENYRTAIATAKDVSVHKLGRDTSYKTKDYPDGYPGGYAFKTWKDANRRIKEAYSGSGFAVFGLKADWEKDTISSSSGWWHNLIKSSEIVLI